MAVARLPTWRAGLGALAVLGALLVLYADAFRIPFLSDDCVFLDHTNRAPFLVWWGTQHPFFNFWRPWSREFHYGTLQALFGANALVFHAASFALLAGGLAAFHALARRLTDDRSAGIATAGLVAMAAWGLPAISISGVQDLWMILTSLLALLAWTSGRTALATLALAVALLSKETSCLLPLIFLAYDLAIGQEAFATVVRRVSAPVALTLVWALVHPQFGGRWFWHARIVKSAFTTHASLLELPARAVGSLVSLDRMPLPEAGWLRTLVLALPAAVLLATGVWLLAGGSAARAGTRRVTSSGLTRFSLAWMLLGWLPLELPSLSWHAYYGLFGAMGAWLLLGSWLARAPLPLGMSAAAALVVVSVARGDTRTVDWADASYQREAGRMTLDMRRSLLGLYTGFPPSTRLYFEPAPANASLLGRMVAEDGATFRVWYHNDLLHGGLLAGYAARRADSRPGPDYFFRVDAHTMCHELLPAERDTAPQPRSPEWRDGHVALGSAFARGGDWARAYAEFAMVAQALPGDIESAWRACATAHDAGDLSVARQWLDETERRAGDDPQVRARLARARDELMGKGAGARAR